MNETTRTEQIESYLQGQLILSELIAFEAQMQHDQELRAEVDLQRSLVQHIRRVGRDELRSRIKAIPLDMTPTEVGSEALPNITVRSRWSTVRPWQWAAAAVVVLTFGIGWVLYQRSNQPMQADPLLTDIPYTTEQPDNGQGLAGTVDTGETYPVLIYPPSDSASYHYRFGDTLRLYGPFRPDQLSLHYRARTETYTLTVDNAAYTLERYAPLKRLAK